MILRRLAAALVTAALAASPAAAQLAQNSDGPVDMTADQLEVVNAQCLSIWRGSAEALQGEARLRADVIKTFFTPAAAAKPGATSNCGPLQRIEAEGSVYYVTPTQKVRGDAGVYEAGSETITMTGDVVAAQGKNVLRGQRMVINTRTGEAQVFTNVKGRNQPGRVRGVFYPDENTAPAR
jgi:lipopolysaccharide export system protein LptA